MKNALPSKFSLSIQSTSMRINSVSFLGGIFKGRQPISKSISSYELLEHPCLLFNQNAPHSSDAFAWAGQVPKKLTPMLPEMVGQTAHIRPMCQIFPDLPILSQYCHSVQI